MTDAKDWPTKVEGIRSRLVKLVQTAMRSGISHEERMSHILFVSAEDSSLYEEAIERGDNGDKLREVYTTEGLVWVHPLFYGHVVFWYAPETKFCHVNDLTREELLAVLNKQREYLKKAYDNRQRL